MKSVWTLTKREFNAFFDSLIAYILLIGFLGFSGFFTWLYGGDVFLVGQASLSTFFNVAYWTLFFFIPALTMRMLAEEKKTGTIEMLLTKSITDRQVIIGKFFGCLLLILVALALTLPYYFTISAIGNPDHGVIWSGYVALILLSGAYISIGLFASSITDNQIVAFLLAITIGILFQLLFQIIGSGLPGILGNLFNNLSISTHFEGMSRGVIDTQNLIYFLSITALGLFLSEASLAKRNITDT